ncbi:hypothetical protein P4O66_020407, partial [Electrophorus voltai]
TLEDSRPSSGPFRSLDEQETEESLNNACLLNDSDLPFDDGGASHDVSSMLVPETPSPFAFRRKRNSQKADDHKVSTHCGPDSKRSEPGDKIPGYLHTTPVSQRTVKRRRLQDACRETPQHVNRAAERVGFVPASSLLPSDLTWLESPRPPPSTSTSCSEPSTSARAPRHTALVATAARNGLSEMSPRGCASLQKALGIRSKEQKSKRTSTRTCARSSGCASAAHLLGAEEERCLQDAETERRNISVNPPACQIQEEIIIVEDEDDAVVVEAMVRSIQMDEDEAFARRLQEQFDREEQLQQEQRMAVTASDSQSQNHPFDSYVGLGWISPWTSMVNSASFSHRATEFAELQQAIFQGQSSRRMRLPQAGRPRGTRHRHTPHLPLELFDDSQGNNYEALLAFEENQGAVVAKNTLSKGEIERLPTKAYDPANNAGKT